MFSKLSKNPRFLLALGLLIILALVSLLAIKHFNLSLGQIREYVDATINFISDYPVLVYLSVMIVGGLPLPLSPFLILAGVVFANQYGPLAAVLICFSAMILSMIWTYFVSAYPLRSLFEKLIGLFADKIPEVPEEHQTKLALILRITPGIPFFLQNYALGVARVPFLKYLVISICIQAFYTTGFVLGGGAIFQGKAGLAIAAVSILIILSIVIQWLRGKNAATTEPVK